MINRAGLELIKQFEGFRAKAYVDPVGIVTIGYGTTSAAGVGPVEMGMTITEAQASEYLAKTLEKFGAQIKPLLKVEANENEWAAMLSLAYNIGPGAFAKSSVLKRFNAGDKAGAANAFLMWVKAGGKTLAGLKRRREAERALFLEPVIVANIPKPQRKSITQSRTAQASAASLMGGVGVVGTAASQIGALSETAQVLLIGFGIVCAVAAVIIFRERLRKWAEGVR